MELPKSIKVNYTYTDVPDTAAEWFKEIDAASGVRALDFEAAVHYTSEDIANAKALVDSDSTPFLDRIRNQQLLNATALSHPSHSYPTHLLIAESEDTAKVVIISTFEMLYTVMEWLVTTDIKQVWHNASFDFKLIYHHTGKFPKNYEDTAQLAKSVLNHVNISQAKVGLKELAAPWYGAWAIAADNFDAAQMYNDKVLEYAATDACATFKLYTVIQEYLLDQDTPYTLKVSTDKSYSPFDLLPAPEPRTVSPPYGEFYDKVSKHLIKDVVRIMANGLPIDLTKVQELESTLDTTIAKVHETLNKNEIVRKFQAERYDKLTAEYRAERLSMCRDYTYYLKPFSSKKPEHRSYFMDIFAKRNGIPLPTDTLPTGVSKWSAKQVKSLSSSRPILQRLLAGEITEDNSDIAKEAVIQFAKDKASIYNRSFEEQARTLSSLDLPPFNPASPEQKHTIFTDMLGFESDKLTDAYKDYERKYKTAIKYGSRLPEEPKMKYSWDRDNIENVLKSTTEPEVQDLCQALIDFSFGAIVKNNFIKAFYNYTIDGRLYGSLKLFGAKSFRLTSSDPNLLNLPSTKSIYSKPVKKCFIAPKGYVVLAIDYGALEDRVIASLSRDTNKCDIFLKGLDGHCLNAYGYFKDEIAQHMPITGDVSKDVSTFYGLVEGGHKELKAIRQKGKPATLTKR